MELLVQEFLFYLVSRINFMSTREGCISYLKTKKNLW